MWLVVGLGNPGSEYARTRHNIGFMVVEELAGRAKAGAAKAKFGAEITEGTLGGQRVTFCRPMEFMNVSGSSVSRVAGFWKVPLDRVLVLHDELDLPWGRLRLAAGGGPGGHNGIKSIIATMGPDFPRVRIGIGRPVGGGDAANFVLSGFSREEQKDLPFVTAEAADAVEAILKDGLPAAMNRFNKKKAQDDEKDAKSGKKTATDRGESN
jgi:peptidyl-tRNA hydrolase, PTH1 family